MTQIRIVFLDIDGTIVHSGVLVASAAEAVRQLQRRGIPVALCTGRSVLHTKPVEEQLSVKHAVYFNGSLVRVDGQDIYQTPLDEAVSARVISYCTTYDLPLIIHTAEEALTLKPIPKEFHALLAAYDYPPLRQIDRADWLAHHIPVFQFNVFMDRSWDANVQQQFPECLLYRWDEQAVDLQIRGSDKSIGARALLDYLGIPANQALHIGDSGNDLGMFHTVGMSVAMGSAPESVQRCATFTTRPAEEDGVYHALKDLGLIS